MAGAADVDLVILGPTPAVLQRLAEAVGMGTVPLLAPEVAAEVRSHYLLGALRPGQSAEAYSDRVRRLVLAARPAAPRTPATARWTLDTLPLPADVLSWGRQLATDLRAYAAGRLAWAEVDRGALLCGPPGCGKTTFAQALAASCGVALISTSYSILESGEDGRGRYSDLLWNMRGTFARAKAAAPSIILVDEIDSFLARGAGGHNESWFTPVMNALLAELDGVGGREGVVVLGATNTPSRIDPALLRPGRLDRTLTLCLPDAPTLARVVSAHLPGLPVADCQKAADALAGSSGADIEKHARGARRRARAEGRPVVVSDILAEAGADTDTRTPAARRRTATHEAGHALVLALRRPEDLVSVTIRRRGLVGGGASFNCERGEDTESHLAALLTELLAGRAAEEVVLGDAGGGCGGAPNSDLGMATLLAASAEFAWGFRGLTWLGDPMPETLPFMLAQHPEVAAAVEVRLQAALTAARDTLRQHRPALDALAAALLAREALTGAEVACVVREARAPVRVVGQRLPAPEPDAPGVGGPR